MGAGKEGVSDFQTNESENPPRFMGDRHQLPNNCLLKTDKPLREVGCLSPPLPKDSEGDVIFGARSSLSWV